MRLGGSKSGVGGGKLAEVATFAGYVQVIVSVIKCVVDAGSSAPCSNTRFKSNSTDVAFGCMFRTHTMTFGNTTTMAAVGSIIGMDVGMGTAGASRGDSDACVALWFEWLQGVSACIDSHA